MADINQEIIDITAQIESKIIDFRRDIHQNPEIGFQEFRTTDKIVQHFEELRLELGLTKEQLYIRKMDPTGVLVDIKVAGSPSEKGILAIRADIDALPLQEVTGLPYASRNEGVMHACGHDMHTSIVLGAGTVLATLAARSELTKSIRLIFQPAEEQVPGGAEVAIEQGGLENVTEIYAVHAEPKVDVGQIGAIVGSLTSATDLVKVTLRGKGGHTSRPHLTSDTIFALAEIASKTPAIIARKFDQRKSANLTWGTIHAGNAQNAIPDMGVLTGTFRTLDMDIWDTAKEVISETIKHIAAPFVANTLTDIPLEVNVEYTRGTPPVNNTELAITKFTDAAVEVVSPTAIIPVERSLGAEDFAYYLDKVLPSGVKPEGAMVRLGTHSFDIPGAKRYDIHQPDYAPDERALAIGAKLLARVATISLPNGSDEGL